MPIKILGALKGVTIQSKLDSRDVPVHTLTIKVELAEGHEKLPDISEHLKEMVELNLIPRQPKLR